MKEKKKTESEKKSYGLPTRFSLTIRIAVGLYLFYTVYSLRGVTEKYTGGELVFFLVVMALFAVIGAFLCIQSARALMTGRYMGGAADDSEGALGAEKAFGTEEAEETGEKENREKTDGPEETRVTEPSAQKEEDEDRPREK